MASPLLRKNVNARPKTRKLNATRLSGAISFPPEDDRAENRVEADESLVAVALPKAPLKESNRQQKPRRSHVSLDTSLGLEDLLDKEIAELRSLTLREDGNAEISEAQSYEGEEGRPGFLASIPAKLRDFHQFLTEDEIQSPDELVKPIEGVLGQGLDAINFIGKAALAVGNIVDNAIEGGINLVSKTASDVRENVVQGRRGNNSWEDDDEWGDSPPPSRRMPRLVGGKTRMPRSKSVGASARRSSSSSSSSTTSKASGSSGSSGSSGKSQKKLTSKLTVPMSEAPIFEELEAPRLNRETEATQACSSRTARQTREEEANDISEALSSKERDVAKMENHLQLLEKEMQNSKVECSSLRNVVDSLQVDLRKTQRQCQELRKKNSQLSRESRSNSGGSKRAPSPEAEEEDPMHDMVRQQMEYLLHEKAKLAAENSRLQRENASLQEILDLELATDRMYSDEDYYYDNAGMQDVAGPSPSTPLRNPIASPIKAVPIPPPPQFVDSPPPPPPGTEDDAPSPDTPLPCPLPHPAQASSCNTLVPVAPAVVGSPSAMSAPLQVGNISSSQPGSPSLQIQTTTVGGGTGTSQSTVSFQVYNPTNGQCMANMEMQIQSK
mmetsp:Transcript_42475/g.51527  ORF Transcript_42475/g.51527 Transcript_42475/m.51527 type:complete len:611 (-) Transcript_42475:701-2533(-)